MSASFDPYRNWLGVASAQRPIDHYQLLGLARFEADFATIEKAARQQLAIVSCQLSGPYDAAARQITAELKAARDCLLDPQRKAAYDDTLHRHVEAAPRHVPMQGPTHLPAPPIAAPPVAAAPSDTAPEMQVAGMAPAAATAGSDAGGDEEGEASDQATSGWSRRTLLLAAGGGLAALLLIGVAAWGLVAVIRGGTAPVAIAEDGSEPTGDDAAPESDAAPTADGGSAPPVEIIRPSADNQLVFPAAAAELHGPDIRRAVQESQEVVTNWTTPDNWLTWRFVVKQPGVYQVEVTYSATSGRGEYQLSAEGAKRPLHVTVRSAGTGGRLLTEETKPIAFETAGEMTLTMRGQRIAGDELLTLASIRLKYDPTFGG